MAAPMAKPAATPMAKPAAPGGGGAARTMFGMPAMTMPKPGGAPAAPAPAAPAPAAPAPVAPVEDVYKATVLGMPAVEGADALFANAPAAPAVAEAVPPAPIGATAPQQAFDAAAEAAETAGAGIPDELSGAGEALGEFGDDMGLPAKKSKAWLWILIGVGGFLTLVGIGLVLWLFVFAAPKVPQTMPLMLPQGIPAMPQVPGAQGIPTMPQVPGVQGIPAMPGMPAMPGIPAAPPAVAPAPAPQPQPQPAPAQ
jgi:hypothetical protein